MADTTSTGTTTMFTSRRRRHPGEFRRIMKDSFDPKEMIDKMVEVIGAETARKKWFLAAVDRNALKQFRSVLWTSASTRNSHKGIGFRHSKDVRCHPPHS